jgi:hypothetical protein
LHFGVTIPAGANLGLPILPTTSHRSRLPKPDRRRALELLASCPEGCSEAIMLTHGFTTAQMVELVRAGLASVSAERVIAGRTTVEIARVRITEAGRRILERGKL